MTALVGPLSMICGVLAAAGVAKIVSPLPTRQALGLIGPAVPALGVRILGVFEVALALATVIVGGVVLPAMIGILHLAFAVVVWLLLRRPGAASCGCFGSLDTPASGLHLAANLVSASVAFAAVGAPGLAAVLQGQAGSVAYMLLVVAGTLGALAVLTLLPKLGPQAPAAPAFSVRASR